MHFKRIAHSCVWSKLNSTHLAIHTRDSILPKTKKKEEATTEEVRGAQTSGPVFGTHKMCCCCVLAPCFPHIVRIEHDLSSTVVENLCECDCQVSIESILKTYQSEIQLVSGHGYTHSL